MNKYTEINVIRDNNVNIPWIWRCAKAASSWVLYLIKYTSGLLGSVGAVLIWVWISEASFFLLRT